MRFAGDLDTQSPDPAARAALFSDTRGILTLSAGEGGATTGAANQADMGLSLIHI